MPLTASYVADNFQIQDGQAGISESLSAFGAQASIEGWEPTSAESSRWTSMRGQMNNFKAFYDGEIQEQTSP
jgi:hypothetical protein